MRPRDLPQLVTGDTPILDVEPLRGGPRRRRGGWLAVSAAALLIGGGVTVSFLDTGDRPARTSTAEARPVAPLARPDRTTAERDPSPARATDNATPPDFGLYFDPSSL